MKGVNEYSDRYAKASATMLNRYGVPNVLSLASVRQRGYVKRRSGYRIKERVWLPVVSALYRDGYTTTAIHKLTRLSQSYVCNLLRRGGIRITSTAGHKIALWHISQHKKFVRDNFSEIYAMYNSGLSLNAIGRESGHPPQVVKRILADGGVKNIRMKSQTTRPEAQMANYIYEHVQGVNIVMHDRTVLTRPGKRTLEIDIFMPDYMVGVEINGEYWHKDDPPERSQNKIRIASSHGVKLLILTCNKCLSEEQMESVLREMT